LKHISSFSDYMIDGIDSRPELPEMGVEIEKILIGGLGGSAIAGDILRDWVYDRIGQPVEVWRHSRLPSYAGSGTLFVGISYSGETAEALEMVAQARRNGCVTCVITSGGRMAALARREGLSLLGVPTGLPPRASLPYLLAVLVHLIERVVLVKGALTELRAAAEEARRFAQPIAAEVQTGKNPAKQLATRLAGKQLFVYAPARLASVARRLKSQVNENSKASCKFELFPELCHNELEGWFSPTATHPFSAIIILRDNEEDEAERRTISEAKRVLQESGMNDIHEIQVDASTRIGRILSGVLFCDYLSFYMAMLKGLDPTPVPNIEKFRKRAYVG